MTANTYPSDTNPHVKYCRMVDGDCDGYYTAVYQMGEAITDLPIAVGAESGDVMAYYEREIISETEAVYRFRGRTRPLTEPEAASGRTA
jgi:hypothetical protein